MIRQRNRKLWGVRHPLDPNFDAQGERDELRELRQCRQTTLFNETLHELHMSLHSSAADGDAAGLGQAEHLRR